MERLDKILRQPNAAAPDKSKAALILPKSLQDSKRRLTVTGLMEGWELMQAVERWDFLIPDADEEPDEWNALGRIWISDCGHLSDSEFIEAIESHRADSDHGMFQPATADINRQADGLRHRRTEQAKARKQAAYRHQHKSRPIAPKEQALNHIAAMRTEVIKARAEQEAT